MRQRKAKSVVREYVEAFVFAIVLALVMRQFVVQAFKIPSASMETTLLVGDHILVNKFLYYFTLPKRLDIVVFQYPWEEDRDFIKRVIGLPGDRVYVRDWQVYVNDQPLHEPYVHYTATFGKSRVTLDQWWCPKRAIVSRYVVTSTCISTGNLCLYRPAHLPTPE